ncbi:plasminogen isoform X1 [Amblyraja radiata]|uniref:plasminogen isoform X1 n=1 Tax=Amblyraja radiata TaxID=386614 RepID=UPI001403AFE3|nr:plasminogen isoform X1 [Amblyraja radiata]
MLACIQLLFLILPCFVRADALSGYVKTEGAWIQSIRKLLFSMVSVEECAVKCDRETWFICRSFLFNLKEQECIITADNKRTQTLMRKTNSFLYEKEAFLLECKSGDGITYRGSATQTLSGRTCQHWSSTQPHKPRYTPESNPYANLEKNFCRNPDNDTTGPWCYTNDPLHRWEYCTILNCEGIEDCMFCSGENYRGKISHTEDGTPCQRWDIQAPHQHGYNPTSFPDKYLEENYCRNPDGEPRPWCITTNRQRRWAYCNISRCEGATPVVKVEAHCYTGKGQAYRGTVATTISGEVCQQWSSLVPHQHTRTPEDYPCKGLENNYCRNPDNEKEPWCYTTNPKVRWEYCPVRKCGASLPEPVHEGGPTDCYRANGIAYRGTTSVTRSGKRCQHWDSMVPHAHSKNHSNFPDAGLLDNFCRNPDADMLPWCFTTDPLVRWEYCRISKCDATPSLPTSTLRPAVVPETSSGQVPITGQDCKIGIGKLYRGTRSITSSGRICQAWSAMQPHNHHSYTVQTHPDAGLDSNYCRNPDSDLNGPWCYTTDPKKRYDYCDDIRPCELPNECGLPSIEPKKCFGRIVGGCISKPHSWPWQVSVRTRFGQHFCGGSLIHSQWVLTAKHCLDRITQASDLKIYLGIHRESALENSRQIKEVGKIVLHRISDIALLKLTRPARLNDKVSLVCLPDKGFILPSGVECYVTGWGETQGTIGDGVLKEAGFPVFENKVCNRAEYLNGKVKSSELCAGNIDGGSDSCQKGDSGGPLVCPDAKGSYIVQGVTSWGLGCARAMKPGVYVRTSFFIDWIADVIRDG